MELQIFYVLTKWNY